MTTIERNAAGSMTIKQAAQIVYGTDPTNAVLLDEARNVVFMAARSGYKFFPNRGGSAAKPNIVVMAPAYQGDDQADSDERRYAEA